MKTRLILILSAVLFVAGCSKPATTPGKVIFAADVLTMAAAPVYVAEAKGFWKQENLDVDIKPFVAGRLALDAVVGKVADAATVTDIPVVLAAFQQHKVRIIATFTTSEKHENMLARKDRGITGPRDLAGKKVALVPGTSSAYVMAAMLQRNGLKPSDLTTISLKPPDMVAAIVRGDVDAIFTWQPHIYNAQKQLGENALVFPSNDIYDSPFNVVVLDTSDASRIQALRHLIAGLRAATQYMQANRRECVEIVAKKIGTDVATVDNLWDQYSYVLTLSPALVGQLEKEGAWAKSSAIVTADSAEPVYPTLVDRRIFDQNRPQ